MRKIKILAVLIFSFLNYLQYNAQSISSGSLFEFYMGDFQKNIRISKRIQEQWDLPNNFLQHTHYNANKDISIDSTHSIKQVLLLYYKKNHDIPYLFQHKKPRP